MATSEVPKQGINASLKKHLIQPFRSQKPKLKSDESTASSKALGSDEEWEKMPYLQYGSLDPNKKRVRLLEILSGPDSESIRGSLTLCDLDERPSYFALSYMWDQGGQQKYIECRGTKIQVGQNLWNFLHQYRHKITIQRYCEKDPMKADRLWIDAICIDQSNLQERNHQVTLMRDIYSGAESTIVWLGLAQKSEELAFLLTRYPSLIKVEEMSTALVDLYDKTYWTRVWVVQEFVLAKSVEIWCGEFQADAAAFIWREDKQLVGYPSLLQKLAITHGWKLFKYRRDFRHSREYKREVLGRRNSRTLKATFRLRDLIQSFESSQSSEVYDKIYGFLGIASTGRGDRIRPDYSKTPVELLVDVLRNQCHHSATRSDDDNHKFLIYLARMLGVSRTQLARHVLHKAPDLEPYIHVLVVFDFMVASVSVLGTIMEVGSFVHQAEAFQENMWTVGLTKSPMHPPGLSNSDIRDLGSIVAFTETRRALSFEDYHSSDTIHHGKWEKMRRGVVAKSTETVIQGLIRKGTGDNTRVSDDSYMKTSIGTKGLQQIFRRSFGAVATQIWAAREDQSAWDTQPRYEKYTTFLGSNNIIGIICTSGSPDAPEVTSGDHICVFSADTLSQNALIVRHNEIERRRIIIGFAVIISLQPDTESRGVVRSIQQAFGRTKSLPTRTEFNLDDALLASKIDQTLCFHCHLTDILELNRCGILDVSQLDRLLERSLKDVSEDEEHMCKAKRGRHEILEFGL